MIDAPKSTTHLHLLCILNTELKARERSDGPIRVLDAGCGDGLLIDYLTGAFSHLFPETAIEVYGYDVGDHGVQFPEYMRQTREYLSTRHPEYDWDTRLKVIESTEPWPYSDGFFDAIVSNQVLEHVADLDLFFGEIHRTLRPGGFSAHLFPILHNFHEVHLTLPFAHWFKSYDSLRQWIALLSKIGLGKYRLISKETGETLDEYATRHADYLHHFTNYRKCSEYLLLGKTHALRTSFRYTRNYYFSKFRQLVKSVPTTYEYSKPRSIIAGIVSLMILRRVSSVTLFFEKANTYRLGAGTLAKH